MLTRLVRPPCPSTPTGPSSAIPRRVPAQWRRRGRRRRGRVSIALSPFSRWIVCGRAGLAWPRSWRRVRIVPSQTTPRKSHCSARGSISGGQRRGGGYTDPPRPEGHHRNRQCLLSFGLALISPGTVAPAAGSQKTAMRSWSWRRKVNVAVCNRKGSRKLSPDVPVSDLIHGRIMTNRGWLPRKLRAAHALLDPVPGPVQG